MKTLKKTLCLVLAVVMVVGVLVLPANAADNYDAAIATLEEYGILKGKGDGQVHAELNVTRADMAAIVYRILTGDTDADPAAANTKFGAYANKFKDLTANDQWAKGYIGFCASEGILKGDQNSNVKPNEQIVGYEVQAMLLRALGYDKNNEYTGANWTHNVQTDAAKAGITNGVTTDPASATLRGAVAQMTYNTAVKAYRVRHYLNPLGYYTIDSKLIEVKADSTTTSYDIWGAPTHKYTLVFTWSDTPKEVAKSIPVKASDEFWTPKTECDVATKVGLKKTASMKVYTNGWINETTTSLNPTNTTGTIGGQGRWTRIFDTDLNGTVDRIVYVDTILAKVTDVAPAVTDAAGHVKETASMKLDLYLSDNTPTSVTQHKVKPDATPFTYAKGDYVLVNYIQNGTNTAAVSTVDVVDVANDANVFNLVAASSFNGKQTTIWYNADKHTIDNVEYNDNLRFHLDQAGVSGGTHTWFKDSKGNLIGAVDIDTVYTYGVITKLWWSGESSTGAGKAMADVVYMDGSKATIAINSMTVYNSTAGTRVSAAGTQLTGVATYSIANTDVMTVQNSKFYVATDAATNALLDMDPQDSSNGNARQNAGGMNDIIDGHLFRFEETTGGKFNATEVAGKSGKETTPTTYNDPKYMPAEFGNFTNTAVTKNVTAVGTDVTKINSATKFLIRTNGATGFVYTPVTGFENISTFPATSSYENDYVDTDLDGYAEYVYITAPAENATSIHTFYTSDYKENGLNYSWNVTYSLDSGVYTLYGYVDGVYGSIKTTDNTNVVDKIVNYRTDSTDQVPQHKLWAVIERNGLVVDIIDLESSGTPAGVDSPARSTAVVFQTAAADTTYDTYLGGSGNVIPATSIYNGTSLIAVEGVANDKLTSNVLTVAGVAYTYVAGKSIMVGDFNGSLEGKIVSIVYNSSNQIVLAYCVDPDASNLPSVDTVGKYGEAEKVTATLTDPTKGTLEVDIREGSSSTVESLVKTYLTSLGYKNITVSGEIAAYATAPNSQPVSFTINKHVLYAVKVTGITPGSTSKLKVTIGSAELKANDIIYIGVTSTTHTGVKVTYTVEGTGNITATCAGGVASASYGSGASVSAGSVTDTLTVAAVPTTDMTITFAGV